MSASSDFYFPKETDAFLIAKTRMREETDQIYQLTKRKVAKKLGFDPEATEYTAKRYGLRLKVHEFDKSNFDFNFLGMRKCIIIPSTGGSRVVTLLNLMSGKPWALMEPFLEKPLGFVIGWVGFIIMFIAVAELLQWHEPRLPRDTATFLSIIITGITITMIAIIQDLRS